MLITFSGLDGSGKSTLISQLTEVLKKEGRSPHIRTMYFHLSFYAQIRALRNLFSGNQNQAAPSAYNLIPNLDRPDISDKSTFLSRLVYGFFRSRLLRKISLLADLLIFLAVKFWEKNIKKRYLITDRYFYDSLADIISQRNPRWFFVKCFIKLCPQPDLPVFVDVPPEVAHQRKREYPMDYLRWRREIYLRLFAHLKNPLILENINLRQAAQRLREESVKRAT